MNTSVIFLDIDGPMLPARSYLRPNTMEYERMPFDPIAVNIIRLLCERFEPCKVILNTTWNTIVDELRKRLDECGLLPHTYFESDEAAPTTQYPKIRDRLRAIESWLEEHETIVGKVPNWVAFDDEAMYHDKTIAIAASNGIMYHDYSKATKILGRPDTRIILV